MDIPIYLKQRDQGKSQEHQEKRRPTAFRGRYLLWSILKGMKEHYLHRFSLLVLRSTLEGTHEYIEAGMKLKISAESMGRGDKSRKERFFFKTKEV